MKKTLKIHQPDVSNLLRRKISKFSTGKLIQFAVRLNLDVRLELKAAATQSRGFHRFFGDAELDSDFLIGFAGSDLFQDVHFAVRKFILADVLGELQGDLRWNSL